MHFIFPSKRMIARSRNGLSDSDLRRRKKWNICYKAFSFSSLITIYIILHTCAVLYALRTMGCRSRWVHQFGVDQWKPWDIVVCKKKHTKPFIKLTDVKWHQIFSWLVFVRRHGQCRPPEKCDNWTKSLKRKICLLIYNTVGCKKIWVVFSGFPIALRHWRRGPPKNALIGISTIFGQILGFEWHRSLGSGHISSWKSWLPSMGWY